MIDTLNGEISVCVNYIPKTIYLTDTRCLSKSEIVSILEYLYNEDMEFPVLFGREINELFWKEELFIYSETDKDYYARICEVGDYKLCFVTDPAGNGIFVEVNQLEKTETDDDEDSDSDNDNDKCECDCPREEITEPFHDSPYERFHWYDKYRYFFTHELIFPVRHNLNCECGGHVCGNGSNNNGNIKPEPPKYQLVFATHIDDDALDIIGIGDCDCEDCGCGCRRG